MTQFVLVKLINHFARTFLICDEHQFFTIFNVCIFSFPKFSLLSKHQYLTANTTFLPITISIPNSNFLTMTAVMVFLTTGHIVTANDDKIRMTVHLHRRILVVTNIIVLQEACRDSRPIPYILIGSRAIVLMNI
jgi:hypothetical protein